VRRPILLLIAVVLEDRVADGNALIADIGAWVIRGGGDQFTNNILAFMAKRATEGIVGAGTLHGISCTKGIEVSYAPSIPDFGTGSPYGENKRGMPKGGSLKNALRKVISSAF
jgi:hypothetical protein